MRILGIGEVIIDSVFQVESADYRRHVPNSGLVERSIGGPVPSALTLLARLGEECTLMAGVGQDAAGDMIRNHCHRESIHLLSQPQLFTQNNTILVPKQTGERIKIRGKSRRKPIEHLEGDFLQQFDLILIDRHEPKAFYECVQKKSPRTKIIIDPSTEVSDFTLDMMRLSEYPVIPIETVSRIGQASLLENLQKVYTIAQKPLIVTASKLGAIIYDGAHMEMSPSYEVAVVDTVGAGDIFRGGLAYGILQDWGLRRCVDFANLVAALECTKYGNISAIPTKRDIDRFARRVTVRQVGFEQANNYFQACCRST